MSIIITNIGGNPLGESVYEVKINDKLITRFTHWRQSGLANCLTTAAKAVERSNWITLHEMMTKIQTETKSEDF